MERKTWTVIGCLILIIATITIFTCTRKPIESTKTEIDSIKNVNDSLQLKVDSIDSKLDSINNWYEKNCSIIINQSVDSDMWFFSEYLSKNLNGFNSRNN